MSYLAQAKIVIEGVTHSEEFTVDSLPALERQFAIYCEEFDAVHVSCAEIDASFATDAFYN